MAALLTTVRTWAEMIKFAHSLFALPFALLATFLAARPQLPTWSQVGLIVLCMVSARSAAMTFNRIVDLRWDAANLRTAQRALPRGIITGKAAWAFFGAACAIFVLACAGFLWLQRNPWPLRLSVPVLALLCGYSFTKHFTRWSHLILGFGIACAPVAAWIAVNPVTLGAPAWLLLVAATFWIGGFDLIYACQDTEFDRQHGLYSVPAQMGVAAALWLARACHLISIGALLAVGGTAHLGVLYFVGVVIAAALLVIENALVSPRDLSRVNVAFFTVNGIVGLVLGILGVLDVIGSCLHSPH